MTVLGNTVHTFIFSPGNPTTGQGSNDEMLPTMETASQGCPGLKARGSRVSHIGLLLSIESVAQAPHRMISGVVAVSSAIANSFV